MVSDNIVSKKTNPDIIYEAPGNWVTKEYLQNILRNYKNNSKLEIIKLKFSPVTAKGESYGGVITRAEIQYKNFSNSLKFDSINLVIKTAFEDDKFAMEILQDFDVFNREMIIYDEILPNVKKLLQEANIDEFLFAETVHIDYKNFTMIFEDLCSKNFQTVNRLNGLNFKHAQISVQKLAKLHAATAILQQKYPEMFQKNSFNSGFFNRQTDSYNNYFITILKACIEVIYEDFDDSYHIYAKKLQSLLPNLIELGRKCFDPTPDQFNTFIHGDIWQSNLMYKYSKSTQTSNKSKEIIDAVLIDFQFCCWAPATVDLHYFFNIALEEEVKRNNQEDLIKFYYEIFSNSLKQLKYDRKIPELNEFYLNFLKQNFYSVIVTCVHQPIALNETPEIDFHAVHGTDQEAMKCKKLMFKNEKIKESLKYWLPIFNNRGLLDMAV